MTWSLNLETSEEDGSTLRQHLESVERQSPGASKGQLISPPLPDEAQYLIGLYLDIRAGQSGGGGFGPSTLSHIDVVAWCFLSRRWLSHLELTATRAMSQAELVWHSKRAAEKAAADAAKTPRI